MENNLSEMTPPIAEITENQPFFESAEEERAAVHEWLDKINHSEAVYKPYYDLIQKTRESYRANQSAGRYEYISEGAYNIFWSGIETQKPFIYFKRPQPYVDRVNKIATPVEQLACKILERALEWDLTQFDFDSMVKYARNDYLISGSGILFETYCPSFKTLQLPNKMPDTDKVDEVEVIDKETVETRYVDPRFFLTDTDHVGVWEEIKWIAKKMYLKADEFIEQFGAEIAEFMHIHPNTIGEKKNVCVYEIWDKPSRRVYWVSSDLPDKFVKIEDDPLHLTNFFPCPKPIYATLSNESLIPVPDYAMISRMIDELNGITERMRLTMQAIKVSGVYDNAFHRLADIFEKDITLVSLSDFDKLKSAGGIRGVIDFIPIEQYVLALEQLARRRDDVLERIYDITGISDIMRGNSNEKDTATAVIKKTNFGTLRNQDRQNDMQRFIADLYRIKGEIICTCFAPENLAQFVNLSEGYTQEVIDKAVTLLKTDKMRGMLIHIESNGGINADADAQKTLTGVNTMTQLIKDALPTVSAQPLLLPLYRQMITAVIAQMPHARMFESVLDKTFADIEAELTNKDDKVAQAEARQKQAEQKAKQDRIEQEARDQLAFNRQLEATKAQQSYEIEKEKNALKARELSLKEAEARQKEIFEQREMELKYALKMLEVQKDNGKKKQTTEISPELKVNSVPVLKKETVPPAQIH